MKTTSQLPKTLSHTFEAHSVKEFHIFAKITPKTNNNKSKNTEQQSSQEEAKTVVPRAQTASNGFAEPARYYHCQLHHHEDHDYFI